MNKKNKIIGNHWSNVSKKKSEVAQVSRWWQSPYIIKHINKVVCGKEVSGSSQGLIELMKDKMNNFIPFKRGISVGGGNGEKEMNLIEQGIVQSFEVYELSQVRISQGKALAKEHSLEGKMHFIYGDAFDMITKTEQYDFVHWNNSLHHMLDVDKAVEWSRKILKQNGLFCMDDFIGSSRFQWPDTQLEIATRIRKVFEKSKYMINPNNDNKPLSATMVRPNEKKFIEIDPSEAADSERIVEAIYRYFPNAEVKYTGGVVYHQVLNDMLNNFDEKDDNILLDLLMIIDELCAKLGQTHYGIALAIKE